MKVLWKIRLLNGCNTEGANSTAHQKKFETLWKKRYLNG